MSRRKSRRHRRRMPRRHFEDLAQRPPARRSEASTEQVIAMLDILEMATAQATEGRVNH